VFQEIAVGEITARNESEETIRSDLGWLDLRPFTTRCAYHAAVIEADLRGRNAYDPTIKSDVLIGRVARPPSVPVVTRSTDDLWLPPLVSLGCGTEDCRERRVDGSSIPGSHMSYRGAVLDLDGTIYRGRDRLPGARAAVTALRDHGIAICFFSNNPTKTPDEYVEGLAALGIDASPAEIVSAASVTTTYLRREHPEDEIFLVGSPGLRGQLDAADLALTDDPDEADVLVASYDREFDYDRLTDALRAVEAGATFVGTDPDMTVPGSDGRLVPGSGAMIHAVAGVADREPDAMCGKPSVEAVDAAVDVLDAPPEECLVVGDRLDTDIALGARCGMTTVLVLTGVTDADDLDEADDLADPDGTDSYTDDADDARRAGDPVPDFVLSSIGDLDSLL
jgi:4-nitrophenyl phosphatase